MKKIFKYLLIFTVMFTLPNIVFAEETETTFDHIDIEKNVSLKYKVLSNEYLIPSIDETLSGIKLYKLDKDNKDNKTEISLTDLEVVEMENSYRINGTFDKYYEGTTDEVNYVVEYSYEANVASNDKNIVYTSDEYSLTSTNNESTDRGLLVKLQDPEVLKVFAPKLLLTKNLDIGTPDGTFTFSINDQTVSLTTTGAGSTVGGTKTETIYLDLNTTYVVQETNIPNIYQLVSISSDRDTDQVDNTITFTTTNSLDDEIYITALNKNKVEHTKEETDNGDGTHKLSLDVTGEVETAVKKTNVVVVMDASHSMVDNNERFLYTYSSNTYNGTVNKYYDSNGTRIYYRNGNWRTSNSITGPVYGGGPVYVEYQNAQTRLSAEQEALYSMIEQLLENDKTIPDLIDISVVSFSLDARDELMDGNNIIYYSHDYDVIHDGIADVEVGHGTNWELGLKKGLEYADLLKEQFPSEDVYVIFLTDGEPTARDGSTTYTTPTGWGSNYEEDAFWKHWSAASDDAREIATKYHLYTIFTYGTKIQYINFLDNLTHYAYGEGTYESEADISAGSDENRSNYFFNATDTSALVEAFNNIVNDIKVSGIGAITINDGTTQSVTASTGVVSNLLTVDTNSYEYWLTFPVTDGNKIKFNDTVVTVTQNTDGTYRLTWMDGETSRYVDISVDSHFDTANNTFVYKWTGANQLYNVAPPQANMINGAVSWTLSRENVGLLLNGVKYTVTFDVWPSQETYDLISDLDNGLKTYDNLDSEIKKYLIQNPDGSYILRTNTTATLKYDDSRDTDGERITEFVNPDPIPTGVSNIVIKKHWKNDLDEREEDTIEIYLTRDGLKYGEINASNEVLAYVLRRNENWEKSIYISTGLISFDENTKTAIIRETGHDYCFEEKPSDAYYWDLQVDVRRPMMINNTLTMLVKTTDVGVNEIGSSNYLERNGNRYFKICDKNGNSCAVYKVIATDDAASIDATNWRRSNLNITKMVKDNDYKGDTFRFELTVNDALSTETNVRDVWFSIVDKDQNIIKTATVTGATIEVKELVANEHVTDIHVDENARKIMYKYDGTPFEVDFAGYNPENNNPTYYTYYYYTPSGTKITVDLEPTWNLRFLNLPNGSTYTFTEIVSNGYEFVSAESSQETITSRTSTTNDGGSVETYTVNGVIGTYNTSYLVTYTNKHIVTDVEVIKVWVNDNENIRPVSITVNLFNGGNTPIDTQVLTSSNDWKYTWSNLDKYDRDGNLITYSVTENTLDDYYTKVEGFTITNTYKYTTVKVDKVWENTPEDKKVDVVVKIKSTKTGYDYNDQTTLNNSNNWAHTFNVLKYILNNNDELELVTYGVEEVSINGVNPENAVFVDYNETLHAVVGKWTSVVTGDMDTGFVVTNTYKAMPTKVIKVKKLSFNNQPIAGAVFVLYRYIGEGESVSTMNIDLDNPGSNWLFMQEATSDSNGNFAFDGMYDENGNLLISGLYEGEYRLIETKAPGNYILPKGQWILFLELSADESKVVINPNKTSSTDPTKTPALLIHDDSDSIDIDVYNEEIPNIPSTGGIGMTHNNNYGLLLMLLSMGMWLYYVISPKTDYKKIKNN